jgi:radical SAM superfamily enzyme YgiQ (UPF0313 family)
MANLGFQAVYSALNALPGVSCERAVLPEGPDLRRLERQGQAVLSLETGQSLGDFDVLAFSVTYELDYLNVVRMLEGAGIPADREERNRFHPLVVAGGAALTVNHEPLLPLLDGWFRGEAEGRLEAWSEDLRRARSEGLRGRELWEALGAGEGADQGWQDLDFRRVRERGGAALEFQAVGTDLVTPDAAFGASALVEICRGCPWRCSFCIAKDMYGSFRKASQEDVLSYAARMRPHTDRIGLVGAGISAYPKLTRLLADLRGLGYRASLSSMRLDRVDDELLDELARHGQRTLTVAPENFSDRLQGLVEKSLSLGKIMAGLRRVGPERFEKIKLYMIAGLPGQTAEDHGVAFETARELVEEGAVRPGQLEFSYSVLLPRPGTALGDAELLGRKDYKATRKFLEASAKEARAGLKVESYRMAMLCDLLCRGDREVGLWLLDWARRTKGRSPLKIDDAEYRRRMEGVLARHRARGGTGEGFLGGDGRAARAVAV